MQTNIDISKALVETPDGVLSIHQISKKLKLPYGTAYNRIHVLHKLGVVQILHQGKAKLCAMNPDNSMTASLLALGAAQKADLFINSNAHIGNLFKKIRSQIFSYNSHCLSTAILLTPDNLKNMAFAEEKDKSHLSESELSLDFFFIKTNEGFDEAQTETALSTLFSPDVSVKITNMTVDRNTLLGMLTENENEAGLAAYSMLHGGLIIFGYENFYSIVLEAFSRKFHS